jgi:hypothetical protein
MWKGGEGRESVEMEIELDVTNAFLRTETKTERLANAFARPAAVFWWGSTGGFAVVEEREHFAVGGGDLGGDDFGVVFCRNARGS